MKIVPIQALRAAAALLVVMVHAQHEAAALAARTAAGFAPSGLLPWPAGVDVFFVISGFIIVHASAPLYARRGGRRVFAAHRIARLVPLYWLVTLAYLALALANPGLLSTEPGDGRLAPAYVAASFLFWPVARADGLPLPVYGLGWTLNCEMFFYALFALGLGWGRRAAVGWLVTSLAVLAILRAVVPALPMPLAFWASPVVLEFAFGAVLGLARAEGLRLGAWPRIALTAAGLALLVAVPNPDETTRVVWWGLPAALLVAAAALGGAADALPTERSAGHALAVRAAVALGDASYALYLVHPFVLRAAREAVLRTGLASLLGPWGTLAAMVALAVLAALAVHRLVERPLTRRVRAWLAPSGAEAGKRLDGGTPHVSRDAGRV